MKERNSYEDWSGFLSVLLEEAEPYLKVRGDLLHVRVSHRYALMLMEKEGGDKRIIEPAVLLHDVGWSCLSPEELSHAYGARAVGAEAKRLNRIHEREGAEIAARILTKHGYDPKLIETIRRIIERHDSSLSVSSVEDAIVKDADKLWRFSGEGFWVEIERQGLEPEELYLYLGKRIDSWFFTPTGRILSKEEWERRGEEVRSGREKRGGL
ncbi:MAG: HD domain-containing protein [Deltaproteobacteria bacterium]|nr:HD domain-containing protein [Deltaproteobacteria bacterium]MBW2302088.1 HD domain-containing protein [Deltaproteobacteria bacterium]